MENIVLVCNMTKVVSSRGRKDQAQAVTSGLWTLSPVRRLCRDLAGARSGGKFIVSNTGEAYDSQYKFKLEIPAFYTLADLEARKDDSRGLASRKYDKSTTPGDKPCCA